MLQHMVHHTQDLWISHMLQRPTCNIQTSKCGHIRIGWVIRILDDLPRVMFLCLVEVLFRRNAVSNLLLLFPLLN